MRSEAGSAAGVAAPGTRTALIMCTTPLSALISAVTTLAVGPPVGVMNTPVSFFVTVKVGPRRVGKTWPFLRSVERASVGTT